MARDDEPIRVEDCACTKATAKAILVTNPDWPDGRWVPLSVVHDDSDVYEPGTDGTLVVAAWWGRKEGLE